MSTLQRRQSRQVIYLLLSLVAFLLYYIYSARTESSDPFYARTESALLSAEQRLGFADRQQADVKNVEAHHDERGGEPKDGVGMRRAEKSPAGSFEDTRLGRRIKDATERAKAMADAETVAEGAAKRKLPHQVIPDPEVKKPLAVKDESPVKLADPVITLNALIAAHPLLLFSKTYCPHSAKAKRIMQQQHAFTPPPFVVELDERETHPPHDGRLLQDVIKRMTGRGTVPNLMVLGESVGGGSELEALMEKNELVQRIEKLSKGMITGKRVT